MGAEQHIDISSNRVHPAQEHKDAITTISKLNCFATRQRKIQLVLLSVSTRRVNYVVLHGAWSISPIEYAQAAQLISPPLGVEVPQMK